ncbi:MAG: DoxX family protein [Bacteroidetes bacterium]|nr:DoxX family protein [Bacteroidota bacterium]
MKNKFLQTSDAGYLILVRLMTGFVFLSEGIQKFLSADALGVGRFLKIGIPYPEFSAPFVGIIEIVAGILIVLGLVTRLAALLLLIDISVAIITTKIPMLHISFWTFAHEARTDFCMFIGTILLLISGGGKWSADKRLTK